MTRVIVTGAGGFLGKVILERLAATDGLDVIGWFRTQDHILNGTSGVASDLTNTSEVRRILIETQPDVVVHAAGRVSGSPKRLFEDNAATTATLANEAAALGKPIRLIAIGSAAEYGRPNGLETINEKHKCCPESVYGHAKLAATNYLIMCAKKCNVQVNVLRVFNLISPVNSPSQVLGAFIERAMEAYDSPQPRIVTLGRLDAIRDFVSVCDLVSLVQKMVEKPSPMQILNVCSGQGHRVRDLIDHLNRISGQRFQIVETGTPSSIADCVIGDPKKFLEIANLNSLRSVYDELTHAWKLAVVRRLG